ncbi:ankyrin repeat domain-containing protein [Flavobacterium sp. TAB 87]|uniref:ankyrin repeat domain-containing protein n=1 Tax=Flavobacterium sp. TAB 87 TaxID=1729581 RepID=UPI00076D0566|nr:ankyrin repeat domain-containing protein [Flavobacterium sp. TAB 87]KVV13143.1 ankyrin repeat protein [Flavobacterium sp. TAB 87]
MKNKVILSFAFAATLFVNAQQKNSLLDQNFWKTTPNAIAVEAEINKGNNPSELNDRSFDPVVLAINNEAPTETIKLLLEQAGNSVTKSTHDNRNYLHWAAYKGNSEIVNYLIAKGADINLEDSHGTTPITFAANASQNNTAVYDAFFKAGINPKTKYKNGANLLLIAIAGDKDLALTNYFISKGMALKDVDNRGNTAFDYAARSGNIALLKTLIQKGVKYTDNALLIAAEGSRREANTIGLYRYLVEDLKLKPTTVSAEGQTVLNAIVRKPKQSDIINYFLSKGVDSNKADKEGNTSLLNAARATDTEALELLLPTVKNINLKNTKGESALTVAVQSGTPEAVAVLLSKKADVKVLDKDGNNLGFYLIQSYKPQNGKGKTPAEDPFTAKKQLLQNSGLNLASIQKDGSTLYHVAVLKTDLNLLEKLADLKIDINAKNQDGMTALHKAAMVSSDDTLLKYLVAHGAKKEITSEFNETAYALAKENETLSKQNVSVEFLKL